MILLIDNYDSFTYNLVQYIRECGSKVKVVRNDQLTLEDVVNFNPTHIVISPGPGNPDSSGICLDVVKQLHADIPIFGVCLGHQIIAQAFGGMVKKAVQPMHGKVSIIQHDQKGVFRGLETPLPVTRYHSLIVDSPLPDEFDITAETEAGEIMALRHKCLPLEGVQFHPEAILTEAGLEMIRNFLKPRTTNDE
ncbi:aminodeoxychorismate/anthranilate synthase component II [Robertmurraya massiliosenegalensis]|uniref:anthranilate synthase component II n=1 Tax=Robertmurraya TaxID=2837507 RepID=UPI0039A60D9C